MPETRSFSAQRGFTLIEVLVALSILSIAVLAGLKTMRVSTVTQAGVREKTIAEIVAQNKLVETTIAPFDLELGRTEGTTEMAGLTWQWIQSIEDTPQNGITRIAIEVNADDGREIVRLVGFRGQH